MEEASSGTGAAGDDFLPSSTSLQLGKACSERLGGGRGLHLGPGRGSRRARRAQRGNRQAVAALGNLRRHGRSREPTPPRPLIVSPLPPRGQTGSAPPGRATDGHSDQ
ncbi:hypothetical protein TREES_T100009101 [Tupaia chinensis]|uniref:Uncharacterized protein n=1 Tax=Tupaia chinensis TaxID=246437 RepID=L9KMZ7_TUPCH|nr:hypothetical protein TREES_T100009101 [Tupaia chinensis]